MCTSHVAGNTQWLVSMGKQRKSKAMWLSMQWKENDKDFIEVTTVVVVCKHRRLLAMMRGNRRTMLIVTFVVKRIILHLKRSPSLSGWLKNVSSLPVHWWKSVNVWLRLPTCCVM